MSDDLKLVLQRMAFAVPRNVAVPTDELLEDILRSQSPDGVDPNLVMGVFGLTRLDGVSFLFREGFAGGLLVPGFRVRTAKNDGMDGFVGVFYPERTGTELPFDTNVASEIAAGLMNPMGREEYGRDLNRVVYKWGTSHGTTTQERNQGFAYHSADWRCGKATGIAPVVLGRLTDQVLAIRSGPWLFTGDFA